MAISRNTVSGFSFASKSSYESDCGESEGDEFSACVETPCFVNGLGADMARDESPEQSHQHKSDRAENNRLDEIRFFVHFLFLSSFSLTKYFYLRYSGLIFLWSLWGENDILRGRFFGILFQN
jgi:hypothetical protein